MGRVDHAAAHIERRREDPIGAEPFQRKHRSDDVDNGIERADLVQVDLFDRHVMNRCFDFREPLKHRLRAFAAGGRERRLVVQAEDLRQRAMRMMRGVRVVRMMRRR